MNNTMNAFSHQGNIEVQQHPKLTTGQLQVCQDLRCMNFFDFFNRFQLHNNQVANQEIQAIIDC